MNTMRLSKSLIDTLPRKKVVANATTAAAENVHKEPSATSTEAELVETEAKAKVADQTFTQTY